MRSLFLPALNTARGISVTSNTVTLSGIGTNSAVTYSGAAGSLIKNGINVSQTTTVSNGDTLAVSITSSTAYSTPLFGIVTISGEPSVFSTCTLADPTKFLFAGFLTQSLLDLKKYQSGQDFVPSATQNSISVYSSSNAFLYKVTAAAPAFNTTSTNETALIASYYSKSLLRIDLQTQQVISSIALDSFPAGLAYTPTSSTDSATLTWVTLVGSNTVVAVNAANVVVYSFSTGSRPQGIAAGPDGKDIYIANSGEDTVTHLKFNGTTWISSKVTVAAQPFEIVCDSTGNAWVTCLSSSNLYKITPTNSVSSSAVGANLRGIDYDYVSGTLWVASLGTASVKKVDPSTGNVLLSVLTDQTPYHVACGTDGTVYVGCLSTNRVHKIVNNVIASSFVTDPVIWGMGVDSSNNLWVENFYSNTPDLLYTPSQIDTGFSVVSPALTARASAVASNNIVLSKLDIPTPVAIPNLYGAVLTKNGVDVAQSTTGISGDVISYRFTVPSVYDIGLDFPILVGNVYGSYLSKVAAEKIVPDPFVFVDVVNAGIFVQYTSNTITIKGVDSTALIAFAIQSGNVILNGVNTNTRTATVKLNDTVAIKDYSPATNRTTKYNTVTAGTTQSIWRLSTNVITTYKLIRPAYKHTSQFDQIFAPDNSNNLLTKVLVAGGAKTDVSLKTTPTNTAITSSNRYVPSYLEDCVYRIDTSTAVPTVAKVLTLPAGAHPYEICTTPQGRVFVSLVGSNSVRELNSTNPDIVLPFSIRGISAAKVTSTSVYVASPSSGNVYALTPNSVTGAYELSSTIRTGGAPSQIVVDSSGRVWVSDLVSGSVYKIVNGVVASTISKVGNDIWAMATDSTRLWTANSYDNTVTRINLSTNLIESIISVQSAPNGIVVDATNKIWVSHYGTNNLIQLDPASDMVVQTVSFATPVQHISVDATSVWADRLYQNMVSFQDKLELAQPMPTLAFTPVLNAPRNTTIRSNAITISSILRPTTLTLDPNSKSRLIVNNNLVGLTSTVDVGDVVQVEVDVPNLYYAQTSVVIAEYSSTGNIFFVQTEYDTVPDTVQFSPQFDLILRKLVTSNNVVISGISPAPNFIPISVSDPSWAITVNGVERGNATTVALNDVVSIRGMAQGQWGSPYSYVLTSNEFVIGSLNVVNKPLDGPVPKSVNAVRDVAKATWVRDTKRVLKTSVAPAAWALRTKRAVYVNRPEPELYSKLAGSRLLLPTRDAQSNSRTGKLTKSSEMPTGFSKTNIFSFSKLAVSSVSSKTRREFNFSSLYRFIKLDRIVVIMISDQVGAVPIKNFATTSTKTSPVFAFDKHGSIEAKTFAFSYIEATPLKSENTFYKVLSQPIAHESHGSSGLKEVVVEYKAAELSLNAKYVPAKYIERTVRLPLKINQAYTKLILGKPHAEADAFVAIHGQSSQHQVGVTYVRLKRPGIQRVAVPFVRLALPSAPTVPAVYAKLVQKSPNIAPSIRIVIANPNLSSHDSEINLFVRQGRGATNSAACTHTVTKRSLKSAQSYSFDRLPQATRSFVEEKKFVLSTRSSLKVSNTRTLEVRPRRNILEFASRRLPVCSYIVNSYTVAETAPVEGAYATADLARAAGEALGYSGVLTVMLPQGYFMWKVPAKVQVGPCGVPPIVTKIPVPVSWYVHGG